MTTKNTMIAAANIYNTLAVFTNITNEPNPKDFMEFIKDNMVVINDAYPTNTNEDPIECLALETLMANAERIDSILTEFNRLGGGEALNSYIAPQIVALANRMNASINAIKY